ncbi:rRNA-binding ribosome biosynthesis protein UTP23 KNAG_0F02880 [Huiozyma naganishii CBS 8797]|uniref:U three protein 23 n=1 Tax=Huiozyma naganishii (strain ATCC MYA-139 / BCRC 22969 / CBS 8797 / KCTC 17520 / NBRC 10181 / NCYC 3082 / Yp74L-3) TaxID=1071383 RepID=J7R7V7_HUIN7|nr:hypothetical protein KNAG_0F02880 [Kazachstania naganishii CBS 8797]CCK70950.1 hypothetical protein KNAG_0F02880 [Kazachstania naganishii CBS 8797]
MRQKRAKSYRKQLLVYNHTFRFREPYQVILDDEIVLQATESKFDLYKALQRTVQAEVKLMITQCCMQALYATNNRQAIDMAKRYERRRCNHPPKDPKSPFECIESVVDIKGENKHRYIVACQNIDLRRKLRRVPGVPLIHVSRAVMIMEPLSDASARISKRMEQQKLFSGLNDAKAAGIKAAETEKVEDKGKEAPEAKPKKRKLGPKQPNPLSMKKKKKDGNSEQKNVGTKKDNEDDSTDKKKRKRRHKAKKEPSDSHGESQKQDESDA